MITIILTYFCVVETSLSIKKYVRVQKGRMQTPSIHLLMIRDSMQPMFFYEINVIFGKICRNCQWVARRNESCDFRQVIKLPHLSRT